MSESNCCQPFAPEKFDGVQIEWNDKRFLYKRLRCIFHIPLGFGKMMEGAVAELVAANAKPEPDLMVIADECSPWRSEVYIEADGEVADSEMRGISGIFECKVFEGPYKDSGKWYKEMRASFPDNEKVFAYYTTCPACAKKFGKNYVVLLAKVG